MWKDNDGSIITPSILGLRSNGSCVTSRVILGCIWNGCLSGVSVSVLIFRRTLLGYYAEGMHAIFFIKFNLNTANDEASAKASPFHALIVLGKNDCPYWLVVWPICLKVKSITVDFGAEIKRELSFRQTPTSLR